MGTEKKQLRYGYTTGACATAATKSALIALITSEPQWEVTIWIPAGKFVSFQIRTCEIFDGVSKASVIKDGGDDPDATHGATIEATVSFLHTTDITIDGGIGVGKVTKKGLPLAIGQAAINPIPRQMIEATVKDVLKSYNINRGVKVVISVPQGEEIAKKTLNPRLGIIGGISILGTRGIVVPFSNSAYKQSITQAIAVAKASGCTHIVITTGGRSEKYGMQLYPSLPEEAFIEMGDFVGWALKQAKQQEMKKVSIVGMMGKLSKLANKSMNLHSKSSQVDFSFLANVASSVGVAKDLLEEIKTANTAMQVGEMMEQHGYHDFFQRLCELSCLASLEEVGGEMIVETHLYTLAGSLLGGAIVQ